MSVPAAQQNGNGGAHRGKPAERANGGVLSSLFGRFARATSRAAGRPTAFAFAVVIIVTWAVLGPVFGFSGTWQLVINTTTTIVTFLMVFLMQSTQNRDTEALQVKIDELIRAVHGADEKLMALDDAEEAEVTAAHDKYRELARDNVRATERVDGRDVINEVEPH